MLKSPEEYFADINFAGKNSTHELNQQELAFVEKYMGMDALQGLPVLQPAVVMKPASPKPVKEKIPEKTIVVVEPEIITAPAIKEETFVPAPTPPTLEVIPQPVKKMEPATPSLREIAREEGEVQMVSFFVDNQLFLLPVAGIQEVIRHVELVKVPMAPDFVAGVVNLRGRVTPLVYLSSLLTDSSRGKYDDRNFIIICGTEPMRVGLIIDKVNSMHMLPEENIIWNAEAKIGEAAEFLSAIANLNDKVVGIVAPDIIIQKLLGQ